MAVVSALYKYPVKSCAPVSCEAIELDAFGVAGDRRFVVTTTSGRFLSQRIMPKMALITTCWNEQGLHLSAPGHPDFHLDNDVLANPPRKRAQVWSDELLAGDCGEAAALWCSAVLGETVRLLFMDEPCQRIMPWPHNQPIDAPGLRNTMRRVSFADGFPLLLLSDASVTALNARMPAPAVEMINFRPNIVVTGVEAHAEDGWKTLRIGEVTFTVAAPCERCVLTTVDPARGERREDGEPLLTLKSYRSENNQVLFGQNLMHRNLGTVKVGDTVEVLEPAS